MDKVDKGFELIYWKLSYRRKFIRTLWLIPWAVASLVYIQIAGKNYVYTMIAGIIYIILLPIQVVYNYKKWMKEKEKDIYLENRNLNGRNKMALRQSRCK